VLDLAIRGGTVIDGTGVSRRRADVGIHGGRIVAVGELTDSAQQTVDASGSIVAPGFIDIHTHYDVQGFWDPTLSPSPLHGVTTVIGGNCGFSVAPLDAASAAYLMPMLARVEGMPLRSLAEGVPWDWSTTAEYLARLESSLAVNAGFLVGHSALRRVTMGDEAVQRAASPAEVEAMAQLLDDSLRSGGMGFSSSIGAAHSDADGRPVPSRHADFDEIVELAAVCRRHPGTSLEFMPAFGPTPFDPAIIELMTRMSVQAQRPLNWNNLKPGAENVEEIEQKLAAGDYARQHGGRIVALVMPTRFPAWFNFDSGFVLDMIPGWAEVLALPAEDKLRALADPAVRARLKDLRPDRATEHLARWHEYVITETFSAATACQQGRSVADIAAASSAAPLDALLDIVCADRLRTTISKPVPDDTADDWAVRATVLRDHRALVGASDAGAHLDVIGTFNYTTRLLADGVRRSGALTTEEVVHMLTQAPAALYGIRNRGVLAPGAAADIVIFDEATVDTEPLGMRPDLPAGASRLYAGATGIHRVIVNGSVIVENGSFTERRPGSILRSGIDTHTPALR
jgi:N-acyl-D-aspartate/D-glutamate deacylase